NRNSPRSGRHILAHGVSRGGESHRIWPSPARGDTEPARIRSQCLLCADVAPAGAPECRRMYCPHGCRRGPHDIGPDGPTSPWKESSRRAKKIATSGTEKPLLLTAFCLLLTADCLLPYARR